MKNEMTPLRALVLVHGHHRSAPDWERIVWGAEGLPGRVPVGIETALLLDAEEIVFGSGVQSDSEGFESDATFALLLSRAEAVVPSTHPGVAALGGSRAWVFARVKTDRSSQTTSEEARAAVRRCAERGLDLLACVSSSTHLPRCLRDASAAAADLGWSGRICGFASPVPFVGTSAADVVVLEPPHRPDRPSFPLAALIAAVLAEGPDTCAAACAALTAVLARPVGGLS